MKKPFEGEPYRREHDDEGWKMRTRRMEAEWYHTCHTVTGMVPYTPYHLATNP